MSETEIQRVRAVIEELDKIGAQLEERGQDWPATRLSYCTGGLVNLLAFPPEDAK